MNENIFHFELLKRYPTVRKFIITKPLKQSVSDMIFDLVAKR